MGKNVKAKAKVVKKKIHNSIFNLYKQDKTIEFDDDEGNTATVIMHKLTQGERQQLLEEYIDILADIREKYLRRDKESGYYTKNLELLDHKQLVISIISYEKAQRSQITDLYPIENEENMTQEQRIVKEEEIIAKWETERLVELEEQPQEKLLELLKEKSIEGLSMVEAGQKFYFMSLHKMCRDPEGLLIFKTVNSVQEITDKRILEKLLEELNEFRQMENMKNVRQAASDPDFLAAGESEEDSTVSQNTTTETS